MSKPRQARLGRRLLRNPEDKKIKWRSHGTFYQV
jgi:hypothetical protein